MPEEAEEHTLPSLGVDFLAFMVGIAPGVFLVFKGVHEGTYSDAERTWHLVLAGSVYLCLGGIFGWFRPDGHWKWGFSLSLAGLLLVLWNETQQATDLWVDLGYLMTAFAAAGLGSYVGGRGSLWARERRKKAST